MPGKIVEQVGHLLLHAVNPGPVSSNTYDASNWECFLRATLRENPENSSYMAHKQKQTLGDHNYSYTEAAPTFMLRHHSEIALDPWKNY